MAQKTKTQRCKIEKFAKVPKRRILSTTTDQTGKGMIKIGSDASTGDVQQRSRNHP